MGENAEHETPSPADSFDRRLLDEVQLSVPLVCRPFDALAGRMGCSELKVIERIRSLRGPSGFIRQISGIFDASALGYERTLAAFRVGPDDLSAAGDIVSEHPGVSHCYQRTGPFNLWFTLAVSPSSRLGLAGTVAVLARKCNALSHMSLPAEKCYKLNVRFAMSGRDQPVSASAAPARLVHDKSSISSRRPSEADIRAISALQRNLPAESEPFEPLAQAVGLTADELLDAADAFLARRWMRRYAAVLHHRRVAAVNVMVAWRIDRADADAAAAEVTSLRQVSHCFLRAAAPDWPFEFYTMIHCPDENQCRCVIDKIASNASLQGRAELWTRREFKKQPVQLFNEEERLWEDAVRDS